MYLPTNAIALLGNEYARKCCRRGMSGVLRQRTWGILLPKRTLDRLSGRPVQKSYQPSTAKVKAVKLEGLSYTNVLSSRPYL